MKQILFPASCAVVLAASLLASCGGSGDSKSDRQSGEERAVTVRVEVLTPVPFAERIELTGTVKAMEDVTVSPEEGGVVRRWLFEKGRYVGQGTVIAQLDDDVIKAGYDAALAQYNTSQLVYSKQEQVYAEQAISESQLKTSQYTRDAAKAQADLMKARLERMRVRAPVSGILDDRLADEGEMAPPGVPLARIVNLSSVRILVNVPERYAGRVRLGVPVDFTVIAYPGDVFRGRVTFVGSAISPDNRTFPVEATLRNPGGRLKPEMIARVSILQDQQRKAILIPEEVVQQVDRGKQIVYVEEKGRAHERNVVLGGRSGNTVEVDSGLKAGDRVITSGYQNVVDGQPVAVAPAR